MAKIIVVGGGYAGISAATALAEMCHSVDLLESRGSLWGRVYSIPPSENFPAPLDNGPHLFMGCYRETQRLMDRLGVQNPFHWIDPLTLAWFSPNGRKLTLRCPALPAPLHLIAGLLTSNAFSFRDKLSMIRALSIFSRRTWTLNPGVQTVAQFLDFSRQGTRSRERFWVPLCNAVMNVPPEIAPIRGLGDVLHRIFFGTRRDSSFAVAAKPLSEIAFPQVEAYLQHNDGRILLQEGVQAFRIGPNSFELETRSGKIFTGDALIWAVPPGPLSSLWPPGVWKALEALPGLGKSPIVTVNVILSHILFREHFVGLPGAQFEWVFNRNANWGWRNESQAEEQYLSFTASAAAGLSRHSEKQLVDLALSELRERCPSAGNLSILHSKVTREMAATFSWSLESDKLRLPCETPISNVFLAGDWTATGLPATIEGACLSGHLASEKAAEFIRKKS